MSFKAVNWAWEQRDLSVHAKMVLLALANRHNPDTGCFPSLTKIGEDVGCSRSTVIRCLELLQSRGLISAEKGFRQNGSQTSNRYVFGFEVGGSTVTPPQCHTDTPPVSERHPHKQVRNKQLSLNKDIIEQTFEKLWSAYPVKKGKGAAKTSFEKAANKLSLETLAAKLDAYIISVQGRDKRYIPHLTTWLNQGRWDDEIDAPDFNHMTTSQQMDHILGDLGFVKATKEIGNE